MSRGNWTSATNQTLSESSYINVIAQATIDVTTRVLTVIVETYYTGTVPQGVTNNINVALLQNIPGPQGSRPVPNLVELFQALGIQHIIINIC